VSKRLLALLASLVVALGVATAPAGAVSTRAHQPSLQFIGQAIIPTGTTFAGTTIGGLSSITYDSSRNVYYVLSDDQSQINPARFYTLGIDVGTSFGGGATCTSTPCRPCSSRVAARTPSADSTPRAWCSQGFTQFLLFALS
jgi:hypothetical protein